MLGEALLWVLVFFLSFFLYVWAQDGFNAIRTSQVQLPSQYGSLNATLYYLKNPIPKTELDLVIAVYTLKELQLLLPGARICFVF